LVVIEAPFSQDRSIAVINELRRAVPEKPIKYVVNTHHHFDHSGGLRAYAAHGAAIVTHESNRQFFEQAFSAPRTLAPDQLARSELRPEFHTFSDKLVLADETRTLQLYHLEDSQHATGMVMAFLPAEKLLIEADVFNPPPRGTAITSPLDPEVSNLIRNIRRRSLQVEQIVPLHGQPVAMAELLKVFGPEK
jgi:glyoxylase-like metal-dependent hydrolase (beta-lactamase superfamily II)